MESILAEEEEAVLEEEQYTEEEELVDGAEIVDDEADNEPQDETTEDSEEEVIEITLGDESLTSDEEEEDKSAPAWVKDLRKTHKETQKQNRELQRELDQIRAQKEQAPQGPPQLGNKPTLEQFDYDSEKYEAALGEYYDQKRQVDDHQRQQEVEVQRQQQEYQEKLAFYEDKKKALPVRDYEDVEQRVVDNLDLNQQQLILQGAEDPALVVYAIGKSPNRVKELAAIKDPIKFVREFTKLEMNLKVNKRRAKPSPEGKIAGSGRKSGTDSTMKKLEAEALKTGDMNKLLAYERKVKARKKTS